MAKNTVKFQLNNANVALIDKRAKQCILKMAYDIAKQARFNAPVLTSALRNSITAYNQGDNFFIVAGGLSKGSQGAKYVNYAAAREVLPNRKNPASQHYMRNAMNTIMTGDYMKTYFKGVTK